LTINVEQHFVYIMPGLWERNSSVQNVVASEKKMSKRAADNQLTSDNFR